MNESYFNIHFYETIQVDIGIHIGKAVNGIIQIDEKESMIVMGYPVNVAFRLQDASRSLNNSLVVSYNIYGLLNLPPAVEPVMLL
jgi:adenylate cyclase